MMIKTVALCLSLSSVAHALISVGTPTGVERRDLNGEAVGRRREVGIAVPGGGGERRDRGGYGGRSNYDNNNYNNNNGYRNNNNNYSFNNNNAYNNNKNKYNYNEDNNRYGFAGGYRNDRRYNDDDEDRPGLFGAAEKFFRRQQDDRRRRQDERKRRDRDRDDFNNYGMGNRPQQGGGGQRTIDVTRLPRRYNDPYEDNRMMEDNRFYDAEAQQFGNYDMQRPQRSWAAGDRFENDRLPPRYYEDDRYMEENDRMNRGGGRSQSGGNGEWWENPNPAGPYGRMRGREVGDMNRMRRDDEDYYNNNNNNDRYDRQDNFYRGGPEEPFRGGGGAMTPMEERRPMPRSSGSTRVPGGSYHSYEDRSTTIHGGSLHTFPLDEAVDRVQVFLQAEAPWMPVEATLELWQGPDFVEELAQVHVPANERPFTAVFDTRQNSAYDEWTVVVRNTGPVEHPILASVESYR